MHTALLATLAAFALLVGGCQPAAPNSLAGFRIDYATGSIPPPYNYTYSIDATFDDQGVQLTYSLQYMFREGMTEAELAALGYSADDDIQWSGRLDAGRADAWRQAAREAVLNLRPDEVLPGSDAMVVTIRETEDRTRRGTPAERSQWQAIATEVDAAARAALGIERPAP